MRPDEHKKKKNLAYKKKHGIPSKGGASAPDENQNQKKKKDGQKTDSKGKNNFSDGQTSSRQNNLSKPGEFREDITSESSEDERESSKQARPRKTFKRREIVSNWQKYELEPEVDEKLTSKGENFQKLLNETGSALSHFRFKDELDWESGLDPSVEESGGSEAQFLSINPASLTETLSCLPMHKVLAIDSRVFPEDHLASIIQTADERKLSVSHQQGGKASSNQPFVSYSHPDESVLDSSTSNKHEEPSKNLLSSTLAKSPLLKVKATSDVGLSTKTESDIKSKVGSLVTEDVVKNISQPKVDNVSKQTSKLPPAKPKPVVDASIEDDLDFLLSLDSPQSAIQGKVNPPTLNGETKGPKNKPSVPQQSGLAVMGRLPEKNVQQKKTANPEPDSADLEDWLDSVLDS